MENQQAGIESGLLPQLHASKVEGALQGPGLAPAHICTGSTKSTINCRLWLVDNGLGSGGREADLGGLYAAVWLAVQTQQCLVYCD